MAAATIEKFDIDTCGKDFSGEGRRVEVIREVRPGGLKFCRLQMRIHVGQWTFSVVWGSGTYCSGARGADGLRDLAPPSSPDAEVAVWPKDGAMIDLNGDSVEGWVSPASLLTALEAAERDDIEGIRAALLSKEGE